MKDIKVQFAKDGITVEKIIIGENHYQLTLITPAEPKPETPEPTLTVPENVEFVNWLGDPSLKYNDLILTSEGDGFVLSSDSEGFENCKPLKLIPCKLDEVQNGEWVVHTHGAHGAINYRLITSKGAVSFCSDGKPIEIEPLDDGSWQQTGWLKVVQG